MMGTNAMTAASALKDPLKVMIVDDEPLARARLRGLVEATAEPRTEVVAEAGSASQAQAALREHNCDLMLLDVQMPGPDGMQLAAVLRELPAAPLLVFVTAHAEHALRAFELEAIDFLTKPVRRERLQATLQRAALRQAERQAMRLQSPHTLPASADEFLTLTERGRLLRLPLDDVLYVKAELKYLTVRTASQCLVMDGSLSELEQRWGERFLRVHRNALVARSAIRELEHRSSAADDAGADGQAEDGAGWAVRVAQTQEWLAVSRRQMAAVREALSRQD